MYYSLILSIGSIISLIILLISYFLSLKEIKNVTIRQKLYRKMILLVFISFPIEILMLISYKANLSIAYTLLYKINILIHLIFFNLIYYHIRLMFTNDNPKTTIEIFFSNNKKDNKNIYSIFSILTIIYIILFVKPSLLINGYDFVNETVIYLFVVYLIFANTFCIKIYKKYIHQNENVPKSEIRMFIYLMISFNLTMIFQTLFPKIEIFTLGSSAVITILYLLKENYYLLMIKEIEKLKKNIEKSSNSKLDFLFNMSHDLRSPMNAIVGLSQSFKDGDQMDDEAIKKDLKSIKYSCTTLVDIINNILDVNKIAKGNEELHEKDYNLNKLLAELPGIIEARIGSRPIKLYFDIDQNISSKMIGDTVKLYRVILNILTNSVKYTEVGRITLTIKGRKSGQNEILNIKISDTGYGIKEEDAKKMFTKFNRLDDATENEIEGTGLGLVITKKYVEMMGGTIWFDSIYNAGTTFYIELPQRILDSTPLSAISSFEDEKKLQLVNCSGKKALIVDNNLDNQEVTNKILQKYNFNVETTENAETCLYKFKLGEEYDIIFVDHSMTDEDGMNLANIIKNLDGFKKPVMVAFTANVMEGIKEKYLQLGYDAYLSKPVNINELNELIGRYFK